MSQPQNLKETNASTSVPDYRTHPREFLKSLYEAAVRSALPIHTLSAYLPDVPKGRTVVIGAGKAAGAMAQALEALWPQEAPLSGMVVTRYGHVPPQTSDFEQRIEVVEAAHPVPDDAGLEAAERMLALVQGLGSEDLVLCLISGGGSALLTLPAIGLTLKDKQRINQQLLDSGAGIAEMNCVRKHLSRIKGGRLALACAPARVVTLTISDVPGDDVSIIASGPTVPDSSTCAEALRVLQRYRIDIPNAVQIALEDGSLETPKPGDNRFTAHAVHLIARPRQSLEAAAKVAGSAGIPAYILSDEIEGESREVGRVHAALARAVALHDQPFARPCVILSGGETTVAVRSREEGEVRGRGGRAGEFCMGLAHALAAAPNVWALAADTDGIDGIEDNAGAFVTPDTIVRAGALGKSVIDHMERNDSYAYFSLLGDLLVTGPTHTNVNDFRAILVI